jgi:hypothetical protein
MGALDPITITCPVCGDPVDIGVSATPGTRTDTGALEVLVSIDPAAVHAHIDQHRPESDLRPTME